MSVETQIDRIKANIASAYAKAAEKGAPLPTVQDSGNLPATIEGIPAGGLPEGVRTITLTADPPEGGSVSGGGMALNSMNITVTAEANSSYNFSGWQENGETVSVDGNYSFSVSGDRTLTAAFAEAPASRLPDGYIEVEYIQISEILESIQALRPILQICVLCWMKKSSVRLEIIIFSVYSIRKSVF